ncbi:hypothetical protein B0J14DRAFT_600013 [Halenospora varia]|nr:hypothetical protein B0J14DRAFT_600013 [Halenospora varia]
MSTLCGLRPRSVPRYKSLPAHESKPKVVKSKQKQPAYEALHGPTNSDVNANLNASKRPELRRRKSENFEWAREDQLSVILELLENESKRGTPGWEKQIEEINWSEVPRLSPPPPTPKTPTPQMKKTRFPDQDRDRGFRTPGSSYSSSYKMSGSRDRSRSSPATPRLIEPPPTDLESISRLDASLVFEHFTTEDAWALGSALRNRLLPIPTPVVINISLANQNQTLFHTCTHSGVMPDNDSWVARKRKTVLRWGVSTWYMHCKFDGDEFAFRDKYGLGNSAGEYAIHGGGVPIRVTGVEGVVAVVVVSGLKQHEDHGVIVEVIKEMYY